MHGRVCTTASDLIPSGAPKEAEFHKAQPDIGRRTHMRGWRDHSRRPTFTAVTTATEVRGPVGNHMRPSQHERGVVRSGNAGVEG